MNGMNAHQMTQAGRTAHGEQRTIGSRLGASVRETTDSVGKLRIPELVLGFFFIFEGSLFGIPVPFNQVAVVALILLSVTRRYRYDISRSQWALLLLGLGVLYVCAVSMTSDPSEFAADWKRRAIRLALMIVFIGVTASGRIDFRSLITGIGVGSLVNAVAFYLGVAPDTYGGVLSGWFGDKNVAGLGYAIYGLLAVSVVQKKSSKVCVFLIFGLLVWFTGSRTSIAGYVSAGGWILLAPRLPVIGRWLLGVVIWIGVLVMSEDYSRIGVFSDRTGSDQLRARIDRASEAKVGQSGFFGEGLGEAYIVFPSDPNKTWFFHNSYWSALVEGGWPWLLILLIVTIVVCLRPFTCELTATQVIGQALAITLVVCSWRLGEVLFTLQWALAVAFAMRGSAVAPAQLGQDAAIVSESEIR